MPAFINTLPFAILLGFSFQEFLPQSRDEEPLSISPGASHRGAANEEREKLS